MTTHTPGPWRARGGNVLAGDSKNPDGIAECWRHPEGGFFCPEKSEAEANARLIAAAPDMLAALKALNEAHQAQHYMAPHRWHELAKAADEAIAKAEGIAP